MIQSWDRLPLADFAKTGSGGTPNRSEPRFYEGGSIPWVKSGELRRFRILDTEEKITPEALASSSAKLVPKGAILIALYGATVGQCSILEIEAATNQAVCSIVPNPKICESRFLYYYLLSIKDYLLSQRAGGAQPNISQALIKSLEVPLPPLPEQQRIVEILDQADTLRQQRRKADELSQRILPALFHEMFGNPNRNEKEWPTLPLDEAFDDVSRKGNKIPRSDYLATGAIPVVDQGQDEIAGYWDEFGDAYRGHLPVILFGDHTRIFKLLENPFCIGADGVRLLRPKTMNCHFAFGLLALLDVPSRGYSRHFKELRSLSYINPPLNMQERFGKALNELRKLTATSATSAATLETLFQTLLHRAFDGSLTAKWREGHAKELLQEMEHQAR